MSPKLNYLLHQRLLAITTSLYTMVFGLDLIVSLNLKPCLGRGAHVEPKGNLQNCFSLFKFSFSLLGFLEFESHRVRVVGGDGGVVESNLSVLLWSKPGF